MHFPAQASGAISCLASGTDREVPGIYGHKPFTPNQGFAELAAVVMGVAL